LISSGWLRARLSYAKPPSNFGGFSDVVQTSSDCLFPGWKKKTNDHGEIDTFYVGIGEVYYEHTGTQKIHVKRPSMRRWRPPKSFKTRSVFPVWKRDRKPLTQLPDGWEKRFVEDSEGELIRVSSSESEVCFESCKKGDVYYYNKALDKEQMKRPYARRRLLQDLNVPHFSEDRHAQLLRRLNVPRYGNF